MTSFDLDTHFDLFTHTAFRLEARPTYNVGGREAERVAAYRERRPRPERSVRTDPWLARIAVTTTQEGKQWRRLRVLDDPLTDYQRFQLFSGSYLESQTAGDETLLIHRDAAGLASEHTDFWLFDEDRGLLMDYTPGGQFTGVREADAVELHVMRQIAQVVVFSATPLANYLAGLGVGVA